MSCGEVIKEQAEICPNCGVRQQTAAPAAGTASAGGGPAVPAGGAGATDARTHELQKIAGKDKGTVMLVSFLITPLGYLMVGKTLLAVINFLTANYFFLGWIIVPFHTKSIIESARRELEQAGVGW